MQYEVTERNKRNLEKLAQFLFDNIGLIKFDMKNYIVDKDGRSGYEPSSAYTASKDCGTTCCALGWAPNAGLKASKPGAREYWDDYFLELFTDTKLSDDPNQTDFFGTGELFEFLFDFEWHEYDNTVEGAIMRIRYFLKFGIPEDFGGEVYISNELVNTYTAANKDNALLSNWKPMYV